jgi:alkylation response protein AidB-like acyl-CoA dehydrogenase
MDYQLTEQEKQFQKNISDFLQEKIAPKAAGLDQCGKDEINIRMRENLKMLADQNILGAGIKGDSLDLIQIYLAGEEISKACASTFLSARSSAFMCAGALTLFGSPQQKEQYIQPLLRADTVGAIAYTEDAAGTDISAIKTIAGRDDNGWLLSGTKNIVINAPIADVFLVLAYTDLDAGIENGMSFFLVDRDCPGVSVGETIETMGMRGVPMAPLTLDGCTCSEILGDQPGKAYQQLTTLMTMGCVGITALCVGIGTACMEISTDHAKGRRAFGRQIGKFQDVGFKLSDMFTNNDLGQMLGLRAAWAINTKEDNAEVLAACAKLFASEAVTKIVNWGMQVFAGHGYLKGTDIERLYRDARFGQICEGTSEMQRALISKHELDRFQRV